MKQLLCIHVILLVLSFLATASAQNNAAAVRLAEGGKALHSVVVGVGASETTRGNAKTLAELLGKISGATFSVVEGSGQQGIAFGRFEDFGEVGHSVHSLLEESQDSGQAAFSMLAAGKLKDRESYVIDAHTKGLRIMGVSDLGAQNGMWDFLRRLGYRQYFPGPAWEVLPNLDRVEFVGRVVGKPDYAMRLFWYSGNTVPERREMLEDWKRKNRMQSGIEIKAGHSWETLLSQLKPLLQERPEFLAKVDGKREWDQDGKFELSNPELRQLLVNTYLDRFRRLLARNPDELSFSVDPSDGGGWSESEESRAMGSVSDQLVTLNNEIATAMDDEFSDKLIGMYAYNYHSHPPTIRMHPRIVVLIGTLFRRTNLTLKDQVEGWAKQGPTVGMRDAVSYLGMDYDLPSRAQGWKQIGYFTRNLKNFYDWGARLYSLETTDSWVINGLLNYAIACTLWDVSQAGEGDRFLEEFLRDCFPSAGKPVGEFYRLLGQKPTLGSDLLNRLYSCVQEALAIATNPKEIARIEDLALYTRYLELYSVFSSARGEERMTAAKDLFTHLYRARERDANHARGLIVDLTLRDKTLWTGDPKTREALWRHSTPPWAAEAPLYSREEIREFVKMGLANHERLPFDTLSFSYNLVPARDLVPPGESFPTGRFATSVKHSRFFTWTDNEGDVFRLKVHNSREPYAPRPSLWAEAEASLDPVDIRFSEKLVGTGESIEYELRSPHSGLHTLRFVGPFDAMDKVQLDPSKPWTMTDSPEMGTPMFPYMTRDLSTFYFYVPKGTKLLGFYFLGKGTLVLPDGSRQQLTGEGHRAIDVPIGADGKFWKVEDWKGRHLQLLTAPPYFARHPSELLLPKEVVEADFVGGIDAIPGS